MEPRLRWYWSLVPGLFAVEPLLNLYAENAYEVPVLRALPTVLALAAIVWALVAALFRLLPGHRPTVVVAGSAFTALFFNYRYLFEALDDHVLFLGPVTIGPNKVVAALLVLAAIGAVLLFRTQQERLVRFAQLAAVVAVTLTVAAGVAAGDGAIRSGADSPGLPDAPVVVAGDVAAAQLPDIYLIVLDSYASTRSMADTTGYDNSPFTRWLESEGFYVAQDATSNYSWTVLSVPSLLNMRYVNEDLVEMRGKQRAHLDLMAQESSVVQTLQSAGYRYVHIAPGVGATNYAPLADELYSARTNEFLNSALDTTALSAVGIPQWLAVRDKYGDVTGMFGTLGEIGAASAESSGQPRFVFAHAMAPHAPFALTAEAKLRGGTVLSSTLGTAAQPTEAYVAEVQGLNQLAQVAISQIKRTSKRPFAIVLVGDHGSMNQDSLSPVERHSVLSAIYFSDGGYDQLYPSASLVNTFRIVFNRYLGTNLPLLEDRSYFSQYDTPYELTDVTAELERWRSQ